MFSINVDIRFMGLSWLHRTEWYDFACLLDLMPIPDSNVALFFFQFSIARTHIQILFNQPNRFFHRIPLKNTVIHFGSRSTMSRNMWHKVYKTQSIIPFVKEKMLLKNTITSVNCDHVGCSNSHNGPSAPLPIGRSPHAYASGNLRSCLSVHQ